MGCISDVGIEFSCWLSRNMGGLRSSDRMGEYRDAASGKEDCDTAIRG